MKITFLGQGYEPESKNSVGNHLLKLLSQKSFHTFTGISAFASEAGVVGLAKLIEVAKNNFNQLNLIVGIDEEGTSKEALYEIYNLQINSFIFHQEESPIFHPKIYLFEGENETKLILGSSNLTARGLFNNVESSLLVTFKNDDQEGNDLLAELKEYYSGLFNFSDKNLFKISEETIQHFIDKGIVPNETVRRTRHGKQPTSEVKNLLTPFDIPKRKTASIPKEFRGRKKATMPIEYASEFPSNEIFKQEVIWQSGKLTERDLNIPTGTTTNPTGSMLFKKAEMEEIDQRHYFRDTIFSTLNWVKDTNPKTNHIERAFAYFRLIIFGVDYGDFKLKLNHNTNKKLKSYEQRQPMTSLSWGDAKKHIADDNLIGKNAVLFNSNKTDHFFLFIE